MGWFNHQLEDVISKESWPCQVVSGETKADGKELLFGDEFAAVYVLGSFLPWTRSRESVLGE